MHKKILKDTYFSLLWKQLLKIEVKVLIWIRHLFCDTLYIVLKCLTQSTHIRIVKRQEWSIGHDQLSQLELSADPGVHAGDDADDELVVDGDGHVLVVRDQHLVTNDAGVEQVSSTKTKLSWKIVQCFVGRFYLDQSCLAENRWESVVTRLSSCLINNS